ncbi:hypothetical protein [Micromonospora sp. IBHARD004]|uniref:hypothetical protein n=1 Tax=Micromonospora sp. IBHARD004 TaxID=3457764 RepID=UPI00405831F9
MTDVQAPGHRAVTPGCVRLDRWWRLGGTAAWHEQVRRCDELLRGLVMPVPFTVGDLLAELERVRGRRLVVRALRTRFAEARALWCRGSTTDHILVGSPGPGLHRDHLALHGVGHMVFGHVGQPAVAQRLRDVLDGADLAALRERSTRVVYTPDEEWQAEVFATRVRQLAVVAHPRPASGAERVLANLATVLEHRPRRPRSTGGVDAT